MADTLASAILIRVRRWLAGRDRNWKKAALIVFDAITLITLVWLAFSFRFGRPFVPNLEQAALMVLAPVIAVPIFVRMGLYRSVLRYLPDRAVWTIVQAVSIATLVWVAMVFLTQMTGAQGIPRTIPVVYWILGVGTIVGSRFGAKWLLHGVPVRENRGARTLVYGAGDGGVQLVNAMRATEDRMVLGFVSDDATLHGLDVVGLRVYPAGELERLVANFGIDEVIITHSSLGHAERREVVAKLSHLPVKVRILPAIADLAAGKYLVSYVRDIDIDDLLGRSQVPADPALLKPTVEGRSVLVTGAAGSIGSALCRTLADLKPLRLVLVDTNEHGLYQIGRELAAHAGFQLVTLLGSVTDRELMDRALKAHAIETIYHCAAYKHVSMVEENVLEGVRNNVLGSRVLAEAAHRNGVANLVLISSDKAVRPSSVMGATKRWSELIVRYYGTLAAKGGVKRNFCSVRFGNVIGSSGSVVPLFKEQIDKGGPITVTHNDMTRYFMSVREAAELIVQSGALSQSGDILLLEMGEPIRIRDLAEDMVTLAGLTVRDDNNPDGDIEIVAIGPRRGEKLHEELFYDTDGVTPTAHPKILRARRVPASASDVPEMLDHLEKALEAGDEALVRDVLFDYVKRSQSGRFRPVIVSDVERLSGKSA
ncbi:MAG: polysaccharide biosynthesis protein [Rhizobiaceae bacterium]|nr:polysaccharide biosynthesis protein [Rhizobiaceae bacterium]MCV0405586.1 polysaccharide biosynthesis protein [Rhizobiaceae bacterium]